MDYQKYMSAGGGKGGDYSQYYQQYMSQGGSHNDTVNLISKDAPPHGGGDYSKFYQSYVPHVKNWSNREEVNAAFTNKYASSYAPPKSDETSADKSSDKSTDALDSAAAPTLSLSASTVSSDDITAKSAPATP